MPSDPIVVAFIGGFISCLMTAFPIAILLLIPHDGWGRHLPSNHTMQLELKVKLLKMKLDQIEGEKILEQQV